MDHNFAAYVFSFFTFIVVLFQLALAPGAPWGRAAMGGKYPGKFSSKLRLAAILQGISFDLHCAYCFNSCWRVV